MHRPVSPGVLILLGASLAFRLLFVASDIHSLVGQGPLYDDSFYALGVARNIAAGNGSTFDGEHPTNGYQPLWVGVLVPLYWLGQGTGPIYLALVLSALLNVLTGWLLFRLLRRRVSPGAAFLGLVLWGFAPAIVRQAVNGLETSLAMFLLALALEYYLTRFRPHPGSRQAVTLGVLVGLAVLARVDALLFAVALLWDGLGRAPRAWRGWIVAGIVMLGVVLPWCLVSRAVVGRMTPQSGEATRFLSASYAAHDIPAIAAEARGVGPHVPLWLHNVGRSLLLLGTCPALHVFTRALERVLDLFAAEPRQKTYAIVALLGSAALGTMLLARHRASPLRGDLGFVFLYCGLLVVAYSVVVFGHIFFSRYYYPLFFFSIVLACYAFDAVLRRLAPFPRRVVGPAVVALYLVLLPYMSWNRLRSGDYRFVNVVRWIESQTPREARVGIFNSGAIGYFSDRRVLNLDGKVNTQALDALRHGDLRAYLVAERIDYVVDHGWILDHFLHPGEDRGGLHFTRIADEVALGVPGWNAYRVTPLHMSATGSTMPGMDP